MEMHIIWMTINFETIRIEIEMGWKVGTWGLLGLNGGIVWGIVWIFDKNEECLSLID